MTPEKNDLIELITSPVIIGQEKPDVMDIPETINVVAEDALLGEPPASEPTESEPTESVEPKKRRVGRPPGSKNKPHADFSDIPPATGVEIVVDYKQMSCALFDMTAGILTNTLGPEWQPRAPETIGGLDERGAVVSAMEVYLKSKNAKDIPPGLMLTIVIVAYAAPRLQAPSTKEKLLPMAYYCWGKIKSFFGRKIGRVEIIQAAKN